MRHGLRAVIARDRAMENWLKNQVGPAYDALQAEPTRAVTSDQIRNGLAVEHRKATAEASCSTQLPPHLKQ